MHNPTEKGTPAPSNTTDHSPPTANTQSAEQSLNDSIFPGERSDSPTAFMRRLGEFAPQLPGPSWKRLFLQTGGHLLAGQAVLQGADSLGHDLADIDSDSYSDLLAADVLVRIRNQASDCPELRLAHLLSFIRTINTDTITIAAGAMPYLGSFAVPAGPDDSNPFDNADLTSRLVEDRLLIPTLNRIGHYTIPPVLQTILRRIYDSKNRHSESRSRRALGTAAAESLHSPATYHSPAFDEALRQVADSKHWSALTELWSIRGHALLFDHFDSTIEAFSTIPDVQRQKSPVLAEAMGDCLQVDEVRRRLDTSDALTVLSEVNFEHAAVPTLASQRDQIKQGVFTVDDIMVMAIASMRRQRLLGQPEQGLQAARLALEHISDSENFQDAPSRLYDARFQLERGITTMFIGDIAGSAQLLRRSIIITELATTSSPYLLLPANAYSALAHAMLGNGPSSDVHLQNFDRLVNRTRFNSPKSFAAHTLARMIRAMDTLDLDAANEFSARLTDPSLGHHSWIGVALYRSLLGILRGDVGIEDKRLQQVLDTNRSSLPADGILRHSLQLILVCLHLAQGQTHLAQNVLLDADSGSPYIILARAMLHLSTGDYGTAANLANRVLTQKALTLHTKATARAVQAASLWGQGNVIESDSAFVDTLEYCRITASLIPVALVPKPLREQLIQRSAGVAEWDLLAPIFANASRSAGGPEGPTTSDSGPGAPLSPDDAGDRQSGERLRKRLLSLGETLRDRPDHTLLSPSQRQLLALLDTQSSVAAIAAELNLVEGTVKNKLSNLYGRLGVRNRRDALARGYEFGYLPFNR